MVIQVQPEDRNATSPTPSDSESARAFAERLKACLSASEDPTLRITTGAGEEIPLPGAMAKVLIRIAGEIADGKRVTLVSDDAELTTQEAADILNVSRAFVLNLLNTGEIPHRRDGDRISVADVMTYKQRAHANSERIMRELAAEAQELNLGYE